MIDYSTHINEYHSKGYTLIESVFNNTEIESMIALIEGHFKTRTSKEYSIRTLFEELPGLKKIVINDRVKSMLSNVFKSNPFVSKALYFNKSNTENWYVPFHQDISIHVKERIETDGYSMWTLKEGTVGVVPPAYVLENTVTLRIHLDDTDETNGALKVIEGSHVDGIRKSESVKTLFDSAVVCTLKKGDAMLMKPLLFHASSKNSSGKPRRVIHIEFNNLPLAGSLEWAEKNDVTLDYGD